ncbi:hypothetical protein LINGRAHAP2_LOCUS9448 [Linum grandiflorum]
MAEVKEPNDPTLPAKRKQFDPLPQHKDEHPDQPNKTQKIQSSASSASNNHDSPPIAEGGNGHAELLKPSVDDCRQDFAPSSPIRAEDAGKVDENNGGSGGGVGEGGIEDEDEEEDGEAVVVDRKGKGIMIEEEEEEDEDDDDDDSDDDSSDDEDGSENVGGDDSELEDDPLAEVDLDNILPSRTRRRGVQPGSYIPNEPMIEDDSDDSDA